MAGNKNPWCDVFSPAEWATIVANATPAAARVGPAAGGHRAAAAATGGWKVATTRGAVESPADALTQIQNELTAYDQIAKDDYTLFDTRANKLKFINVLCGKYLTLLRGTHVLGAKDPAGKQLNDQLDVWVNSLGHRALKKAGYLATMKNWHLTAKDKYRENYMAFSFYLMSLHDNLRNDGSLLHATPYATMEKIDPYHRQTFVFTDPDNDTFIPANEMGKALAKFLDGQPACNPNRATKVLATFYEWLEYHPFCIGTPGVHGDARYKSPNTVTYEGHDLGFAYMPPGQIQYCRLSNPVARFPLNTTDFPASGKGPPGAVAFVWDQDGSLYLHEHGHNGFVHASVTKGRKIRCSGMLVARNAKVTCVTNQSGHYAPTAQNIYYFVYWLRLRNTMDPAARVIIEHDQKIPNGDWLFSDFLARCKADYAWLPAPVPYPL